MKDNTIYVNLDNILHTVAWRGKASMIITTETEIPLGAVLTVNYGDEDIKSIVEQFIILQHTKHTDKRTLQTVYIYILENTRG